MTVLTCLNPANNSEFSRQYQQDSVFLMRIFGKTTFPLSVTLSSADHGDRQVMTGFITMDRFRSISTSQPIVSAPKTMYSDRLSIIRCSMKTLFLIPM